MQRQRGALSRAGLSLILLVAGLSHWVRPELFLPAMPEYIPWHRFWILFTGLVEIAAVIGLWVPRTRRWTSWGLVAYFIAILPTHLHVALNDIPMFGLQNPWLWVRVPFQAVFIVWAWSLGRDDA